MNARAFQGLVLATLAAALAAIVLVRADQTSDATVTYKGVSAAPYGARASDVAGIHVETADFTLTLAREGARWVASDHGNFPARSSAVANLLTSLASMVLQEPKTSRPDRYPEIGVEDRGPGARSTLYDFQYSGGVKAGGVLIGKRSLSASFDQQGATFIRRVGDSQAWLAKGAPNAAHDFSDWFDELPSVPATDIQGVQVLEDGKPVLKVERGPEGRYVRADGGATAINDTAVKRVAQAVTGSNFLDVRSASAMGAASRQIQLETADGVLDIFTGSIDNKVFVRFGGTAGGPAGALIRQTEGFAFLIPGYRLSGLTQTIAELTTPEAEIAAPPGAPLEMPAPKSINP